MFKEKYSLDLSEVMVSPIVYKNNNPEVPENMYPTLNCLRQFAEYCGFSYGALRTALSRGKKRGVIETFKDNRTKRYKLSDLDSMMLNYIKNRPQKDGFTIVIYSFNTEDKQERYEIRRILKYFGFRMLAQNCYINIWMDTDKLWKEIKKKGLEENLFLFQSNDIDNNMIEKIKLLWRIEERVSILNEFLEDVNSFLKLEELTSEEIYNRLLYVWTVLYTQVLVEEPPLHKKYFPDNYPLKEVYDVLEELAEDYRENTTDYYIGINS